jgi:hypothetical protein
MREHPLTASPIDRSLHDTSLHPDIDLARRPYNEEETFPSAMGKGGRVGWSRFSSEGGWLQVSYPEIEYVTIMTVESDQQLG